MATEFSLIDLAQAQKDDEELKNLLKSPNCSLKCQRIVFGENHNAVICDLTGETLRPFVPTSLRERVFEIFHAPAHPGAKVTDRIIRKKYIWPNLSKDVKRWCRTCIACQQSKISRHTHLSPSSFVALHSRFQHVHMDMVGPMPISDGNSYCLTIIDRFSRWPEAIPLKDIEATTICRAFIDGWISRFGAPETVTTDQGSQFESRLFASLLSMTGSHRIRTTTYHPASNGMIEWWHRCLKAAIMC